MMMRLMTETVDARFWCLFAQIMLVIFAVLAVYGIFETIAEKCAERRERKSRKRYTVEIRPERRY